VRIITAGGLALVVVVTLALFLDLGRPAFWDPGESRYAETVREMLLTGNWIGPTLNFARYYDKPPGYFWLLAGTFTAFGPDEWAARLPSAVAGTLTIALVVGFAWRRVGARAALGTGLILATAVQFVALGRSVRMDMLLTLLVTATLLQVFTIAEPGPTASSRTWPLYVLPAVGVLVKGPVALLLPLLIALTFLAVTRMAIGLDRLRPGPLSVVTLAALAAWYVLVAVRAPDYLWTFLWQHNLGRFIGRALAGHHEPIWFYLWVLPVTFLPWTLFLPGALHRAARRARRGERLTIFLLVWCAVPFVFFSLSRAKLATYLLPIFPALALLTATYLDRVLRAPALVRARALAIPALVWMLGMAAVAVGTPLGVAVAYGGYARSALPTLLLAAFSLLGWHAFRRARLELVPALVVAGALATQILFYRVGAPVVDDFSSLRDAALVARELPATAPVFAYKTRGHSFTYYGGRSLLRVRSPADAAEVLGRSTPTAVLVKRRHLEKIRQYLRTPACIWWQSPSGRVLLANIPRPSEPGASLLPVARSSGDAARPRC
jgi:4-amino-4-deoxy-L-arabinose transferase-like glycosyltransferase